MAVPKSGNGNLKLPKKSNPDRCDSSGTFSGPWRTPGQQFTVILQALNLTGAALANFQSIKIKVNHPAFPSGFLPSGLHKVLLEARKRLFEILPVSAKNEGWISGRIFATNWLHWAQFVFPGCFWRLGSSLIDGNSAEKNKAKSSCISVRIFAINWLHWTQLACTGCFWRLGSACWACHKQSNPPQTKKTLPKKIQFKFKFRVPAENDFFNRRIS